MQKKTGRILSGIRFFWIRGIAIFFVFQPYFPAVSSLLLCSSPTLKQIFVKNVSTKGSRISSISGKSYTCSGRYPACWRSLLAEDIRIQDGCPHNATGWKPSERSQGKDVCIIWGLCCGSSYAVNVLCAGKSGKSPREISRLGLWLGLWQRLP